MSRDATLGGHIKMKNNFFILCVLCALFCSCTFVKQPETKPPRTISVNGQGTVFVSPDIATISMAVNTFNRDVLEASKQNAEIVTKITYSLIDAGYPRESISTSNYMITQDVVNRAGTQVRGDYHVTNSIHILLRDTSKVGNVIDIAVKAGANQFSSVEFNLSDMQAAIREARTNAIKNAYEAAKLMAGTSGAMLGKVLTIEEYNSGARYNKVLNNSNYDATSESAQTTIAPGKAEVSVMVHCVYEMLDQ